MSLDSLPDNTLIERARNGDRTAFDALIRKHERRAYQYAFRLTNNADEAADVVADAFVRVYVALTNFKFQSAFSTWLYRILTNCFLDIRKKEKSRSALSIDSALQSDDGSLEIQIEDKSPSADERVEAEERTQAIEDAVAQLPEYQRAMIVMYHGEDMSYEEIAEALDLPIGTVKSRLNRARLSLRDIVGRSEELFRI